MTNKIAPPQPGRIARPSPPAAPRTRVMDAYPSSVARAFADKETTFFSGHPFEKDEVISIISSYGYFKIDTYANQHNPNDIHSVVLFHNKATGETFEVHGTIARAYIESVRNRSDVKDFPISDTRITIANPDDGISYFSRYALRWERTTNKVIKKFYKPYDPDQAAVKAKQHDYDPSRKDVLIGYTEEYPVASDALNFSNWKDEPNLERYNRSIGIRKVGMPTQILLHETAGFSDMKIAGVREAAKKDGGTYFPIPHFCVNNLDAGSKGNVIQFVDVATNVPHGEVTNERAVGIEFTNAPIEAYKTDAKGRPLRPLQPIFNLPTSKRGVYLKTKLAGLSKLFVPLEFSPDTGGGYYELAVRKDKLVNFNALKAGVGPEQKQVLVEYGENVVIKYAKSDKFEHLATLVGALISQRIIQKVDDLRNEAFWKPVVRTDGKLFYIFEHAWMKQGKDTHYFVDIRDPGILTHMLIGGHLDGGLQGLYLFLKFVKRVPVEAILQLMITFLTSDKTSAEAAKLRLTSKVLVREGTMQEPEKPIQKAFGDVLELDEALISAAGMP